MDHTTDAMNQLLDSEVVDAQGNRIGAVENLWLDPATEQPEFVAVKTGTVMGRTHLVPVAGAQIDDATHQLRVPYSQDQIKGSPHFPADANLSEQDEEQVYRHYGLRRSEAPSATGLASGTGTTEQQQGSGTSGQQQTRRTAQQQPAQTGEDQQNLTLAEEQLRVDTRPVEAGRARLRKVVRTERVSQPVELRREQVTVERVPASGQEVPADAFQEQAIEVPLTREEPVVEKDAHVTGQVRVDKTVETEQRTVEGDVRREDVEVEQQGDVHRQGPGQERR